MKPIEFIGPKLPSYFEHIAAVYREIRSAGQSGYAYHPGQFTPEERPKVEQAMREALGES